jgi:2-oxoisovalerate dehydrogenase E2 component (dihydrolipoyl transacylase)
MRTFKLPDLGEGLSEAEIVNWHVSAGDRVVADQPLVSVETDKAVVEVPSPYTGTVVALHAKPGDIVQIGNPIADFDDAGVHEDKGTVVGSVPVQESATPAPEITPEPAVHANVRAMPAVRALARKLNVDLIGVDGTGSGGAITADDVKRYASAMSSAGPPLPLHGVRRAMAQKMEQSHAEIVPASVYDEANVESWLDDGDITVRLIRAIVAGCKTSPMLNAWYNGRDKTVRVIGKIDVGMAINTDDGLFVAVMRDVSNRDDADLRRGLNNLKKAVEARQIPLEEMRGASITLSNFGVSGAGRFANLVVVPPQVAIVGAGTIRPQVLAINGAPVIRRVLPLSLTFDHRVVTGIEAANFLRAMIAALEERG